MLLKTISKLLFSVSPLVWTPNQLVGAPIGSDVTLDCNLESHPDPMAYWIRNNNKQDIIISNAKYDTFHLKSSTTSYKSEMRLRIKDLKPSDFGELFFLHISSMGQHRTMRF